MTEPTDETQRLTKQALGAFSVDRDSRENQPDEKIIKVVIMDRRGRGYGLSVDFTDPTKKHPETHDFWEKPGHNDYVVELKMRKDRHWDMDQEEAEQHNVLNEFEEEICRWGLVHAASGEQFTEDFLLDLKQDDQLPLAVMTRGPKEAAMQPQSVMCIQISGNADYYGSLVDGDTYWLSCELRASNPFADEETSCWSSGDCLSDAWITKRDYINHMVKILRIFHCIDLQEEEDQEQDEYERVTKFLLFGGKRDDNQYEVAMSRYLEENSPAWKAANLEEARVLPFEDEMDDGSIGYRFLMMPETDDWYEVQHRNFMKNRLRIEMQGVAEYCVRIFYCALAQFVVGWALFAVGFLEKDGGNEAVFIASICCGIVMALSSVVGWLSSLSGNEEYIQRFMVSGLVTMSFLTTFLYLEIKYTYDNALEDKPGTAQLGPQGAAEANMATNQAKSAAALTMIILSLGIVFINCFQCMQVLDAINDLNSLQDDSLVFRYFQVRLTEMKKVCEQLCAAQYKQDTAKNPQGWSGPKSVTQWWTRSHSEFCGKEFQSVQGCINTNKSIAVSSGAVDSAMCRWDEDDDDVPDETASTRVRHRRPSQNPGNKGIGQEINKSIEGHPLKKESGK